VTAGDVLWIELPPADGHEQTGRRPAVVIHDETYAGQLPVVLAIPLTTATSTLRFPGTFLVQPTPTNGLRHPSVALVFQLRAVDRRRLRDLIGNVGAENLDQIFATLDKLLGRAPPP
jgi:mRNA interferase MazF